VAIDLHPDLNCQNCDVQAQKQQCNTQSPVVLRQKAEACRELAKASESLMRKLLWHDRAVEWERRAADVEHDRNPDI
jgi:hypothetical protein